MAVLQSHFEGCHFFSLPAFGGLSRIDHLRNSASASCRNGQTSKGLELASSHLVDVVIVDYSMPGMNGQQVAIEMRRLRPQAPIIMLSGAVDVPEQALKLVDAFIAKDRLTSQLLPAIAQLHGFGSIPPSSYDA